MALIWLNLKSTDTVFYLIDFEIITKAELKQSPGWRNQGAWRAMWPSTERYLNNENVNIVSVVLKQSTVSNMGHKRKCEDSELFPASKCKMKKNKNSDIQQNKPKKVTKKFTNMMNNTKEKSTKVKKIKNSKCHPFAIENLALRFPHLGETIFEQLNNKTFSICRIVSKTWCNIINGQKSRWTRVLKNHIRNFKKSPESWKKIVHKLPYNMAKDLALTIRVKY